MSFGGASSLGGFSPPPPPAPVRVAPPGLSGGMSALGTGAAAPTNYLSAAPANTSSGANPATIAQAHEASLAAPAEKIANQFTVAASRKSMLGE
jgi:hypothetical protein